jgi:hypothetical protein
MNEGGWTEQLTNIERLWELRTRRIEEAQGALEAISARWDRALERLRAMVEE